MPPLSDRMRPNNLADYIGQNHIIGDDKLLFQAIKSGKLFSMVLWGPPGVGKTTLARLIANETDADFMEFSAVTTGIAELKKIFEKLTTDYRQQSSATQLELSSGQKSVRRSQTVIFIDEIHRFNKAQQDALLPYVENGTITLIGATTENPSFEINRPLLSRMRVFVLEQLSEPELNQVIDRTIADSDQGLGLLKLKIKDDARKFLIEASNGDARQILNTLEIAAEHLVHSGVKYKTISIELIQQAIQKPTLGYDKHSDEHHNTISAFIKSMRASNADAAIYYLARMVEAGEDPLFIARRMVIFASEDIGMAQPTALVVANEVFKACETIGYPECAINLAHGVVYLAKSKKDRSANDAIFNALADVRQFGNLPIPMNLRNASTKLMKDLGYGNGYEKYTDQDLLPEKLKGKKYYLDKD